MICNIRLATSLAGLAQGYLLVWRLPTPSLPIFNDHSQKITTSDGGQALRGFRSTSLTWDTLDYVQRRTVRQIAESALDSGDGKIYATISRTWNGAGGLDDWIDISGQVHIPAITPIGNSDGKASSGITLMIGGIEIERDPAVF